MRKDEAWEVGEIVKQRWEVNKRACQPSGFISDYHSFWRPLVCFYLLTAVSL